MFQLADAEVAALRLQISTPNKGRGGRRYGPLVFTEHGVAMLSRVSDSERAVRVNIEIMRAFVRLRAMAFSYHDLANKIHALEQKYDARFREVIDAIRALMEPPSPATERRIGFRPLSSEDER